MGCEVVIVCVFLVSVQVIYMYEISSDWSGWVGCISHHESDILLAYHRKSPSPTSVLASVDLGYKQRDIHLLPNGISLLPESKGGEEKLLATWSELQEISEKRVGCYALYDDGAKPWKVSTLSTTTNIPASLCPPIQASGAPTLVLGGFTMHRISGDNIDPMVSNIRYTVLDFESTKVAYYRYYPKFNTDYTY